MFAMRTLITKQEVYLTFDLNGVDGFEVLNDSKSIVGSSVNAITMKGHDYGRGV